MHLYVLSLRQYLSCKDHSFSTESLFSVSHMTVQAHPNYFPIQQLPCIHPRKSERILDLS